MNSGDKTNRLRTERKLSLEKLAEQLNTAKSILWKYEKNQTIPSAETIKKMAINNNKI
ncbi:MAG: helix-turn-helix transcriptional regulator [Spirochaetes bacterium]|nr:helix-turn-helix transcriptional regulator [Spirochaetota bacterium]MBN2769885.1 helix-turn-helix transcriptional regulator [Spirochaetota bacterium]